MSRDPKLQKIYAARTSDEHRQAYNVWANDYDRDISAFGVRIPWVAATVFSRFVEFDAGPILDAACGTGMQTEALRLAGYGPFTGIDVSESMLAVAANKALYERLEQMVLGDPLTFDDNAYAATYCVGALSSNHAPPSSFDELIRVTRPAGVIVFSLRADEDTNHFFEVIHLHERKRNWREIFRTTPFVSMPTGDPDIQHQIFVFEVM